MSTFSDPVRALIHTVGGLSIHTDQEGLLDWPRGFSRPPLKTFVVNGELGNAEAFAKAVREQLKWPVSISQRGTTERLD